MHELTSLSFSRSNSFLILRSVVSIMRRNHEYEIFFSLRREQKGKDRLIFTNEQNLSFRYPIPYSLSPNFNENNHLTVRKNGVFINRATFEDRIQTDATPFIALRAMSRQLDSRIVIPLIIHPLSRFPERQGQTFSPFGSSRNVLRILDANDMILLICPTAYEYYDIPSLILISWKRPPPRLSRTKKPRANVEGLRAY